MSAFCLNLLDSIVFFFLLLLWTVQRHSKSKSYWQFVALVSLHHSAANYIWICKICDIELLTVQICWDMVGWKQTEQKQDLGAFRSIHCLNMICWCCSLPWNFLSRCHCYNSNVSFWISLGTSANHTIRYFAGNLGIVPAVFVKLKPHVLRRPVDIFISFSGNHNWMSFTKSWTISIRDCGHQNRYSKAKP